MKNKEKLIKEIDKLEDKLLNYRGWDSVQDVDNFVKVQIKKIKKLVEKINNESTI
jgi:ribosomal protein L29